MSPLEKFFAFSFISVFSVSVLATWFRYSPTLIAFYRIFLQNNQPMKKDFEDNFNFE